MENERNHSSFTISGPGIAAFLGLAVALGGIVAGLVMEGGHVTDVGQISAALIVFGGTVGAVIVTTPLVVLTSAIRRLKAVFLESDRDCLNERVEKVLVYACRAQRRGLFALEDELSEIDDPFFRRGLTLAIDGTKPETIRHMMELEMNLEAAGEDTDAGVFDAAGGYAPTLGIIGAVMGLIQVMKHLDDLSQVGSGIAVAFVATIYGVGAANLFFLPIGQRIRLISERSYRLNHLTLEGVIAISESLNPRLIRSKLDTFLPKPSRTEPPSRIPRPASAARAASA